jgi:Zn-dependent metalloprotease
MIACAQNGCRCAYLPPHIINRLLDTADPHLVRVAFETGRAEAAALARRLERPAVLEGHAPFMVQGKGRSIYDMAGTEHPKPGQPVRGEADPDSGDRVVDEAFHHSGITYDFYKQVLGRRSLDARGYPLTSSVRYGFMVSNAFWDGSQMLYGEGDGRYFLPFTRDLGIVAHELTHGVINFTSNLAYQGQSGALNESFCDVMGAMVVQWSQGRTVDVADWVMGRGVIGPELGVAGFRTFTAEPAYAGDPMLGDDPQPKHMDAYAHTTDDFGGVHLNSGIPNHALYLAAQALGGKAWEHVGRIWFEALLKLGAQANFQDAAEATVLAARRLFGEGRESRAVKEAWTAVGLNPEV